MDYAFSKMKQSHQAVLDCLEPFTGVVHVPFLSKYANELRKTLPELPLSEDVWEDAVAEAGKRGMLIDQGLVKGMVLMQPVFTFYLRGRIALHGRENEVSFPFGFC